MTPLFIFCLIFFPSVLNRADILGILSKAEINNIPIFLILIFFSIFINLVIYARIKFEWKNTKIPILVVLSLFLLTFFSSTEFKDVNKLVIQPNDILFPISYSFAFLLFFRAFLIGKISLPDLNSNLSKKLCILIPILSFILFFIILDISFYLKSLVHETGHAISIIELKPKSYVYFSFPKATGPQDNPMTMPTKEANLPQYRKALFYLFGVIMEIIAFILFYYIVKYLIWKKEWTKTKDKITNIKKLKFFIFPKIIKLENNTFPLSPDLIKYVSYILIFSIFNNWILLSSGTDIVKFFDTVNIRNGYLFFQKLFATIGLPFIVPFLIDNLIILYLALLVFHQIFNLIIKNKKLYLYLLYFFSILLFVIIIWIIHFQLGNVVLEF